MHLKFNNFNTCIGGLIQNQKKKNSKFLKIIFKNRFMNNNPQNFRIKSFKNFHFIFK